VNELTQAAASAAEMSGATGQLSEMAQQLQRLATQFTIPQTADMAGRVVTAPPIRNDNAAPPAHAPAQEPGNNPQRGKVCRVERDAHGSGQGNRPEGAFPKEPRDRSFHEKRDSHQERDLQEHLAGYAGKIAKVDASPPGPRSGG